MEWPWPGLGLCWPPGVSKLDPQARVRRVGALAALQSVAEVGVGSVLHAFHVPFAGHVLSVNQALILTFSARQNQNASKNAFREMNQIALVASLLKSFSPAGKKLTPMLAISAQGFLYSLGVWVLGCNFLGVLLGSALLALWGVFQPLILAYVLFGESFFKAVASAVGAQTSVLVIVSLVLLKLLVAWILVGVCWFRGEDFETTYSQRVWGWKQKVLSLKPTEPSLRHRSFLRVFLKDIFQVWFLVPLFITLIFLKFGQHRSVSQIWVYGLRPLAVAFVLVWMVRSMPASWLHRAAKKFPQVSRALSFALDQMRSRT